MSGNIYDTDISLIRMQCFDLLFDVRNGKITINELLDNTNLEYNLIDNDYTILQKTSRSLYNLIIKDGLNPNFNQKEFDANLDMQLILIKKIQDKKISQDKASELVGKGIANQYFPKGAK